MILANLRERLTPADMLLAADLLARGSGRERRYYSDLAENEGADRILAEPELLALLASATSVAAPSAPLFLYVSLRHTLRDSGMDDARLADYLGALVLEFGMRDRAYRVAPTDDDTRRYLVDIVADLREAQGRRAFQLYVHLGNYSLWLAGIFPDYVTAQSARRGAPGFRYYDEMGATGFRRAADHGMARELELDDLYAHVAELFARIRVALNRMSDRMFFPGVNSPDRLLRQVEEEFNLSA
jgi:hypothetical protein